ncbi:MAG: ATP synthase subunit C [Thaumarchaeota archaeon]|nr:ATP synthase subunit C [Nitrososphaerota archaeon]
MRLLVYFMRGLSALLLSAGFLGIVSLLLPVAHAQSAAANAILQTTTVDVNKLLAAGIAFGLAAAGAGYGVGQAGAAAIAAVVEKPEVRTTALLFVVLAEAIAIYGIVMAILIFGQA